MPNIAIVGTGFVADLYMPSLKTFPDIRIVAVWDRDPARLAAFATHWGLTPAGSLDALLGGAPDLVLNLTNPGSHYDVSRAALEAGCHVWSEKPLAMDMADAQALIALAAARGLHIGSAPCSVLSEVAQTAWAALRDGRIGKPRLVYAELDDDFIPQAPYAKWISESGAPWPAVDEFQVGCTLEHAGYYLTWLMAMFGPVATVVSASAKLLDTDAITGGTSAPDYSSASLFFESGMVARLTCSIIAPHDHAMRIFGDEGVIEIGECWSNTAPVKIRRRHVIRRRLINSPIARKVRLKSGPTHPTVGRRGAASMNFALGPAEMLDAVAAGRSPRLAGDFALHLTEVSLAIQAAGETAGAQQMTTRFDPIAPMEWARL
ncbi:oxidoreductase [Sphingomonas sp. DBB INV C78]|uniref:Gfo/Idh/MocA family protein n=1 Tax=Sphingomonas sp. DBB INV C78 TaxID=3349434 RepID=UPI0036D2973E